jgi:hypothetical protein
MIETTTALRAGALILVGALVVLIAGCGGAHESEYSKLRKEAEAEYEALSPHEKRAVQRAGRAQQRRYERQQARQRHQRQKSKHPSSAGPPADWTAEEKQQFETIRVLCASEPQRQLASEWEVHNDPGSIAHAIGLEYRNRQDMQIAAEEGCLEALVGR